MKKRDVPGLKEFDIICGILIHEIEMNSTMEVYDILESISKILNKIKGTDLYDDYKQVAKYKLRIAMDEMKDYHPSFPDIKYVYDNL